MEETFSIPGVPPAKLHNSAALLLLLPGGGGDGGAGEAAENDGATAGCSKGCSSSLV